MARQCFTAVTLDDLMRDLIKEILENGTPVVASRGRTSELAGVLLVLENPRARLSRTETKGKPYSCLGELCWYLARTNETEFIAYYIADWRKDADGDTIYGAYGPRLFNFRGIDQFANVADLLRRRNTTRQATIQIYDGMDIAEEHGHVPCTCTLQFLIRQDRLHLITTMRSNDVLKGLAHDVFAFTMLQEIMGRALNYEVGSYKHFVGSIHLYDENEEEAKQFLDEGVQSTIEMPPMPVGNPWPAIQGMLGAEASIRLTGPLLPANLESQDPYWGDLIRLLQVYRLFKDKDRGRIVSIRGAMSSDVYRPFIDSKIAALGGATLDQIP